MRFGSNFTGRGAANLRLAVENGLCGTDSTTVIPVYCGQNENIIAQLAASGAPRAGAIQKKTIVKKWYGIVDGRHRHEAIMTLKETNESWAGFR